MTAPDAFENFHRAWRTFTETVMRQSGLWWVLDQLNTRLRSHRLAGFLRRNRRNNKT